MTITKKLGVFFAVMAVLAAGLYLYSVNLPKADASVSFSVATQPSHTYKYFTFFNATTTTATSTNTTDGGGYFVIAGAQRVTFFFSRGDTSGQGNSGSTNFKIQVTPDGVNWFDYKTLYQNTASSTYGFTASSETISAATSTTIDYMDGTKNTFYAARCIAVETTDGEHTCKASADF